MSPLRYLGHSGIPIWDRITQGPRLASPVHLLCNSSPRPGPWGFWLERLHQTAPETLETYSTVRTFVWTIMNLFGGIFCLNRKTSLCFKHDSQMIKSSSMADLILRVLIVVGCHNKLLVNVYNCQIRAESTMLTAFSLAHIVSQLSITAMIGKLPRQSTATMLFLNLKFKRLHQVIFNFLCKNAIQCQPLSSVYSNFAGDWRSHKQYSSWDHRSSCGCWPSHIWSHRGDKNITHWTIQTLKNNIL